MSINYNEEQMLCLFYDNESVANTAILANIVLLLIPKKQRNN